MLDILCNRKSDGNDEISGNVYINGARRGSQRFSYVPQHDLLLNTATVRETLTTAAQLRLPHLTAAEVTSRVDGVLSELGLTHRADALVGGGEIRGLSGGERRRVSIGQEIVSSQNPVLCLDEPTTGLDSTTAESVMTCLRDLARHQGTIIIATIHQPNSNITALFDDFMLLSHGQCLYLGPYSDAVARFSQAGCECPLYCNPTDYFISVAATASHTEKLVAAQHEHFQSLRATASSSVYKAFQITSSEDPPSTSYAASTLTQISILMLRNVRQWLRDPGMLVSEFAQYIFFALFLGGMYYQMDDDMTSGTYDRTASLFFVLSILVFTPPFTAIVTYMMEYQLLDKERKDNMYSSFSWLLAKSLVLIPVEALLCLVFSSIYYFMAGYQHDATKFFLFYTILVVFQLIGESLGLFFAALTKSAVFSVIGMTLILIVILALSGFLTYEMPYFYEWIADSNVLRFGMLGLIRNEFVGLELKDKNGSTVQGLDMLPPALRPDEDLTVPHYIAILIGFWIGLRVLIYIILCLNNMDRKPSKTKEDAVIEVPTSENAASAAGSSAVEMTVTKV